MSDDTTADAGEQVEQAPATDEGFKPPASQEELDRIIQKRIDRERKRFEDYDDLKASASKVESLEAENADLLQRVEEFTAREERATLVKKVADAEGVDAGLLAEMRGNSEEELAAQANQIKAFMPPASPVIHRQADIPGSQPADPTIEAVRNLFG